MQNKQEIENLDLVTIPYMPLSYRLSLTEDPQVKRTRQTLMIILGVCLALTVMTLIPVIAGSDIQIDKVKIAPSSIIGQAVISILFYGFGLLVAHRYYEIGLRIFAWLTVIELAIMVIGLLLLAFIAGARLYVVTHIDDSQSNDIIIGALVVFCIVSGIYIVAFILSAVMAGFAFKLARLIDAKKRFIIQQI